MANSKCKSCGHSYDEHAGDEAHKHTEPCWNGAVVGDHCACKNYESADK